MIRKIMVTVWNECVHERQVQAAKDICPEGIHWTVAGALNAVGDIEARAALSIGRNTDSPTPSLPRPMCP